MFREDDHDEDADDNEKDDGCAQTRFGSRWGEGDDDDISPEESCVYTVFTMLS